MRLTSDVAEAHRATALNLVNIFFGLGGLATPFSPPICSRATGFAFATPSPGSRSPRLRFRSLRTCRRPPALAASFLPMPGRCWASRLLFLLGFLLFLYVGCEVGVWNWLVRHLIAQGIPESRALNILSLGFALGLLVGRVGVSPILLGVPPIYVTLAASVAMAVTTFLMLRTSRPGTAAVLVFLAGLSMAPVFPTTLAIVGRRLSAHDLDRYRHRHHLRMGRPRRQLAYYRRHRRPRSEAASGRLCW